ncbi:LOW QUALITY PROTEIN: cAMP-responsive element modulator-like [Menidia menidia]
MDRPVSPHPATDGEESPAAPPTQAEAESESMATDEQAPPIQGVIQAPQTSVIQALQVQGVQLGAAGSRNRDQSCSQRSPAPFPPQISINGGELEDEDTRKGREILSRRPSYRKILNELSSDTPPVPRIEEELTEEESPASRSPICQTSSGQYITVSQATALQLGSPPDGLQGAQTLAVGGAPPPGAALLQAAASPHQFFLQGGQVLIQGGCPPAHYPTGIPRLYDSILFLVCLFFISWVSFFFQGRFVVLFFFPAWRVFSGAVGLDYWRPEMAVTGDETESAATGDIPAYQLRSPTSGLAQSIVMAASPSSMQSPSSTAEEVTRKREVRLMKNREAARECRRKKKEYVKCLENRVAVLENQNKTLIEELKALKDIYCHKAE